MFACEGECHLCEFGAVTLAAVPLPHPGPERSLVRLGRIEVERAEAEDLATVIDDEERALISLTVHPLFDFVDRPGAVERDGIGLLHHFADDLGDLGGVLFGGAADFGWHGLVLVLRALYAGLRTASTKRSNRNSVSCGPGDASEWYWMVNTGSLVC